MKKQSIIKKTSVSSLQSPVSSLQSVVCSLRSSQGFTLLELMTVMLIMFIMMGAAAVSLRGVVRGAGVSGAVSTVRAVLTQARQQAIIKQQETAVAFSQVGDIGQMQMSAISKDWENCTKVNTLVGPVRSLPDGMIFEGLGASPKVEFKPDGSAKTQLSITMRERNAPSGAANFTIKVTSSGKIEIK